MRGGATAGEMGASWVRLALGVVGAGGLALGACGSATTAPTVDASPSAGDSGCSDGSETCPCYGNGTCDEGLVCLSSLCVKPGVGGGGGETSGYGVGGSAGVTPSGGAPTDLGGSAGSVGGGDTSGGAEGTGGSGTGSGGDAAGTGGSGVGGSVGAGGSGRGGAGGVTTCTAAEWKCDSGECVHDSYYCNGLVDCADGSDETYCGTGGAGGCEATEWQCGSGECIDAQDVCDGIVHCPDVSDEVSCGTGGVSTGGGGTGGVSTGGGGGTGGASLGGSGGAGGNDCSEETANYPNLVNASGWVGCDPALSVDNPAGIQGAFYVYGDAITCAPPSENPCSSGSCCLDGATIVDNEAYSSWGCGIGFQLNASDPGIGQLNPYQGAASCFAITLTGTSGGNAVRIAFTQSTSPNVSPYVEIPAVSGTATHMVCFSDVACPSWTLPDLCSETGEYYQLQIQVVGAERASTFTLCLSSLVPS